MKRVFLLGANGAIGKAVDDALEGRYEVIRAGHTRGDVNLDISKPEDILATVKKVGPVDAVISVAGRANFVHMQDVPVASIADSPYGLGIIDKLMGQVNLALAAREWLTDGGVVILTSGTTSDEPILGGSSLSMVNGGLEKWVMAAATEMPRGIRVNVVSPSLAEETPPAGLAAFPGFEAIPAARMALAYIRCLESGITGQTLRI